MIDSAAGRGEPEIGPGDELSATSASCSYSSPAEDAVSSLARSSSLSEEEEDQGRGIFLRGSIFCLSGSSDGSLGSFFFSLKCSGIQ